MGRIKKYSLYVIPALLGVVCFTLIYGIQVLNPLYDAWLLRGGDLTQHYIGWEFYRASDWQFPIGLMDKIAYPNSVSVIFTDSIPIFAVLFKVLSHILPEVFQYFGWWEILCFVLQAVFSAKLLYLFTKDEKVSVIGSAFFVMAPIFIARVFFHTALSSQWLLLAAFCFAKQYIMNEKAYKNKKVCIVVWGIMGILCGSIHMYYVPMCGIIMCGFLLAKLIKEKKLLDCLMIGASFCFGAVTMIILFGGLSHDHQLDAGGLGQFSFNMNGFINSMGWSQWLPPLSTYGEGAGDGFAYLGLGILGFILLIFLFGFIGIVRTVKQRYMENKDIWKIKSASVENIDGKKINRRWNEEIYAYMFIVVICILVSASHKFALNGNRVYELPYPDKLVSLWGMFRSSGRFIWPVVYLIMIWTIEMVSRIIKNRKVVIVILCTVFAFQIYDIKDILHFKQNDFQSKIAYNSRLKSEAWEEIAEGKEHVVFVSQVTQNQDILYGISQYAYLHHMTINDFYLAHSAVAGDISNSLKEGMENLQEDTIYIFKMQDQDLCRKYDLEYQVIDEIIVGLKQ